MVANLIDCEASMVTAFERPRDVVGGLVVVAIGFRCIGWLQASTGPLSFDQAARPKT